MKIKKLSEEKIKQIAAGEVINRPYNAIKELIENSIDANSTEISIFLKNYGLDQIIILDNGSGMEKEDLEIATKLHTTSKTTESDQIFGMHSFGFRGEALASIEAISELIIESNGNKLQNSVLGKSNIAFGTKVTINNIFAKLPARLKFIKSEKVEFQYIKEIVLKYAIQYSEITFKLINNEKTILDLQKTNSISRIKEIFKDEAISFAAENKQIKINGYILKTKQNKQYLFANKRPINNKPIQSYINSIFKEYYMQHEAPIYILFIETDPVFIDCNVHPAKEEVKFFNYEEIFATISSAFSKTLFNQVLKSEHIIFEEPILNATPKTYPKPEFVNIFKTEAPEMSYIQENNSINIQVKTQNNITHFVEQFRIIGQLYNSFILFEYDEKFGIFDQHAAHERILYEKFKTDLNDNKMQKLLSPIKLKLTQEQKEYLNKMQEKIAKKGIIIENFYITHLPITLKDLDFKPMFETSENFDIEISVDRLLADIACKQALKANTSLSFEQMHSLLLKALDSPPICNHGRPVFKYFSHSEIQNLFKR